MPEHTIVLEAAIGAYERLCQKFRHAGKKGTCICVPIFTKKKPKIDDPAQRRLLAKQLKYYRNLLRQNGLNVHELQYYAEFKDE